MEILQADDILREEIISDAKIKAERIINKANTEAEEFNKKIESELETIKKEYEKNIIGEAEGIIKLLFASIDIDVKKEITNICGTLINDVFNEVKSLILEDKLVKYKDIISKLIKNAADIIQSKSYIIETSKDQLKKINKDYLLKIQIDKSKINKVEINDNIDGLILYSDDRKVASYISLDKYIEDLKKRFRSKVYDILIKGNK